MDHFLDLESPFLEKSKNETPIGKVLKKNDFKLIGCYSILLSSFANKNERFVLSFLIFIQYETMIFMFLLKLYPQRSLVKTNETLKIQNPFFHFPFFMEIKWTEDPRTVSVTLSSGW